MKRIRPKGGGNRRLRGCKPEVTWLFDENLRKPLDSMVYML